MKFTASTADEARRNLVASLTQGVAVEKPAAQQGAAVKPIAQGQKTFTVIANTTTERRVSVKLTKVGADVFANGVRLTNGSLRFDGTQLCFCTVGGNPVWFFAYPSENPGLNLADVWREVYRLGEPAVQETEPQPQGP